jgi:hypothetical protein
MILSSPIFIRLVGGTVHSEDIDARTIVWSHCHPSVRPIRCRYFVMTSNLSVSKISLLAPDNELGSDDLTFRLGGGKFGGA